MRNAKGLKWFVGAGLMVMLMGVMPTVALAGSGPSYCHDEAKNAKGSNKCSTNTDCDGARTCSQFGWCQGTARTPNPGPKGVTYCHDEAKNAKGPNRCSGPADCDGARTCSQFGWCQGTAGHASN